MKKDLKIINKKEQQSYLANKMFFSAYCNRKLVTNNIQFSSQAFGNMDFVANLRYCKIVWQKKLSQKFANQKGRQ